MKIDTLLSQLSEWLRNEGSEGDIVISSRIRLARNLTGFPFITRATEADRTAIKETVRKALPRIFSARTCSFVDVDALELLDRQCLQERQLISRELVEMDGPRAAVIDHSERFCIMVNEEDHLRIHGMTGGFEPMRVWERINEIDDKLESRLDYTFHEKLGYLTACPTNVGTGLRISVMLHLPALVISKEIDKVFRALQKVNLAVRGLYGEGSQSFGDFYQISNQATLGLTEEEVIKKVGGIIPQIIGYERQARDFLMNERSDMVHDRCSRAVGLLKTARTIGSVEAMHHLSSMRLGINLGILDAADITTVNTLLLHIQPAHLQKIHGKALSSTERDVARAQYFRKTLGEN